MTLRLLHSEFIYIWEKLDFLFLSVQVLCSLWLAVGSGKTKPTVWWNSWLSYRRSRIGQPNSGPKRPAATVLISNTYSRFIRLSSRKPTISSCPTESAVSSIDWFHRLCSHRCQLSQNQTLLNCTLSGLVDVDKSLKRWPLLLGTPGQENQLTAITVQRWPTLMAKSSMASWLAVGSVE